MTLLKKATIICDMQFGSTGKGLIAGYLAERDRPDVVMTAWSANAGHTYIDRSGRKYVHCMLANGVVSPALKYVLIGPGSQLDLQKLLAECIECRDHLEGVEVLIHPNACVISQRHVDEEAGPMTKIGSTKKGCGAALIEKIRRSPDSHITAAHHQAAIHKDSARYDVPIRVCTGAEYELVIEDAARILVEGAQGYSLGINAGFYPYVTSRECTPAQIASDTLLPLPLIGKVVGVMRTYPIRVANRYDENGVMVGWSGPCYSDQEEISFEKIGQADEFTTVTKLKRRVFTFSKEQCLRALRTIRPDEVFLNFCNYDGESAETDHKIGMIDGQARDLGCGGVRYLGFGPTGRDVVDTKGEAQ